MILPVHRLKKIFHFSNLIKALKKEKQNKKYWLYFDLKPKTQKSKFSNSLFDFKSKNEFQKVLSFFNFGYEIEKWKIKNFQNLFFDLKTKRIFHFLNKNWKLKIEKEMSFFSFQFCIGIEMRKNALFHSNFNLKIEWHFRCTDWLQIKCPFPF